jgi:hypothetical protein
VGLNSDFPDTSEDKFVAALIDENVELRGIVVALLRSIMDADSDGINEFLFSSRLNNEQLGTCADIIESP